MKVELKATHEETSTKYHSIHVLKPASCSGVLLNGQHCHSHTALVGTHWGYHGPGVRLWVIHLHGLEVCHPVIAPDGKQLPVGSCNSHTTPLLVKRSHVCPFICAGIKTLHCLEENIPIVSTDSIELAIQCGHTQATPLSLHATDSSPTACCRIEALHLQIQDVDVTIFIIFVSCRWKTGASFICGHTCEGLPAACT